MERDDFLQLMKENESKGKEYEKLALLKGGNLSICVAMILGIIMLLFKVVILKEFDYGVCAIIFITTSIQRVHEGIKLKKHWMILLGGLEGIFAIAMLIVYFGEVLVR